MKVLAVGDIHTKMWIIDEVEKMIDNYDAVVFVGDYADDWHSGPLQSIETWEKLYDLQVKYYDKVHLVVGNHDYIYLHRTPTTASGYNNLTQLILNASENEKLKKWLLAMPVIREIDGVVYSHAGITDLFKNEYTVEFLWTDVSPLWARPFGTKYVECPQVFGHTPSKTCWEVQPNIWCIDTFSTYQDDTPIGDYTVLEITDGTTFNKIKMEKPNGHNDNPPSI